MKQRYYLFLFLGFCNSLLFSQTICQGEIIDEENQAPILNAEISVFKNEIEYITILTDENGYFSLIKLDPGHYNFFLSSPGYIPCLIQHILIKGGATNKMNFVLEKDKSYLCGFCVINYIEPITQRDLTTSGSIFTIINKRTVIH